MEDPDTPPDWNDAITKVKAGDETAAWGLVESLYPHIIRIVRSHLPRSDDEEDLAQEIFMKMFSKIEQFKGHQPFHHWVARIALNTCYDRLRHQRSRPLFSFSDLSPEQSDFLEATLSTSSTPPANNTTSGELARELLQKLIATLKPREQMVIRLLDLEEHSVKETCELTGWGASKVKVTAMRARRKLADALKRLETSSSPSFA